MTSMERQRAHQHRKGATRRLQALRLCSLWWVDVSMLQSCESRGQPHSTHRLEADWIADCLLHLCIDTTHSTRLDSSKARIASPSRPLHHEPSIPHSRRGGQLHAPCRLHRAIKSIRHSIQNPAHARVHIQSKHSRILIYHSSAREASYFRRRRRASLDDHPVALRQLAEGSSSSPIQSRRRTSRRHCTLTSSH